MSEAWHASGRPLWYLGHFRACTPRAARPPPPVARCRLAVHPVLELRHTADLRPGTLDRLRALLEAAFDDLTEADVEHALGGLHALAWDGERLVGHASVVQRRLLHQGRALRTGYVEAVAVEAAWRRQGLGGRLMAEVERVIHGAYEVGALGAADEAARLYRRRGWRPWQGPTWALTPRGVVRTAEDDDGVHVLEVGSPLDLTLDLTCDFRDGDAW